MTLTARRLRGVLRYYPTSGRFVRLEKSVHNASAGGINSDGYRVISVDGKPYYAHRLAVLWMTGAWPKHTVDHRNGRRSDNRWRNLRDVTKQLNIQNQRRSHKRKTSGLPLGVCFVARRNCYFAQLTVNRKRVLARYFKTPGAAHRAYLAAKRHYHEGNTL